MVDNKLIKLLKEVSDIMYPIKVYAVGGCVRDYILGIEPKDYDFCTSANPDKIEARIKHKGRRAYCVGKKFGTIACKIDGEMVEITTFRTESYEKGNRKPKVEFVDDIILDLSRRDFTINSMAICLKKPSVGNCDEITIIDPFQGKQDLKNKLIRCVGIPKHRFKEDPLRILRGIRFATRFDYDIDDLTYKKMESMSVKLLEVSKERWVMELDKILMSDNVGRGLLLLWQTNCFKWTIPEIGLQHNYVQNSKYHKFNLDIHTSLVVGACPEDINMKWTALLHDVAKPFTRTDKIMKSPENVITDCSLKIKSNYIGHELLGADMAESICRKLKFSNERREFVVDTIKNHLNEDCWLKKYDDMGKK